MARSSLHLRAGSAFVALATLGSLAASAPVQTSYPPSPAAAVLHLRGFATRSARSLGTYRVADGTWHRPERRAVAAISAKASLYDNTCIPGPFVSAVAFSDETELLVDTGQVPGTSNATLGFLPGTLVDQYVVDGWRWGVCPGQSTAGTGSTTLTAWLSWWGCLDACLLGGDAGSVPPGGTVAVPGIPLGGTSNVCYLFNVDLANSSLEYTLTGDCDSAFDGPGAGASGDTFGYGIQVVRSDGAPYQGGVAAALGGDPGAQTTGFGCRTASDQFGPAGFIGASTSFLDPLRHIDSSTGLGNGDDFIDAIGGQIPGCFSFGYFLGFAQTPHAGLFHEVYGRPDGGALPFVEYCRGEGELAPGCTPCPCGNDAPLGSGGGCANSAGTGARLAASGTARIFADSLRFTLADGLPSTFAVLISGERRLPSNPASPCLGLDTGLASVTLDGLRCSGGDLRRHGTRATDATGAVGVVTAPWGPPGGPPGGLAAAAGLAAGQARHFQAYGRENPLLGCGTGQTTSQAITVVYAP